MIPVRNSAILLVRLWACGALCCLACSTPRNQAPAAPDRLVLAFSKSNCDFECPTYDLEVHANGEVHFNGRANTVLVGEATKQVPPSAINEIQAALKEADFSNRAGSLGIISADDPLIAVRWCDAKGCDERTFFESDKNIPSDFKGFESRLRKILSLDEWVGTGR